MLYQAMKKMLHCSREEREKMEGSCGGENGEEPGVKTGKDKSDRKLTREMGVGEKLNG